MTSAAQVWAFVIGADGAGDALSSTHDPAENLHLVHGLDPAAPLVVTVSSRDAGPSVSQSLEDAAGVVTVTRL